MTTNRDILFEQIVDAVIRCASQGIVSEKDKSYLVSDIADLLEAMETKDATPEQIVWNIENSI